MEIKIKCVDNGYVFDYDDINGYGDKVNKTEVQTFSDDTEKFVGHLIFRAINRFSIEGQNCVTIKIN